MGPRRFTRRISKPTPIVDERVTLVSMNSYFCTVHASLKRLAVIIPTSLQETGLR